MILDKVIGEGLSELSKLSGVSYRVDNIILGKSIYTMKDCDKVFKDMNMCLLLLEKGYGFSYFQSEIDFDLAEKYVNHDLREILNENVPLYLKVALADAIYSLLNNRIPKNKYRYLKGDLRAKACSRARELVMSIPKKAKVVLLGAVTEIIDECMKRDIQLSVLDLEPSKVGLNLNNKRVENSESLFSEKIKTADYVIATGMIFVSDTADILFEKCKSNSSKLILYMETGSNYGHSLLKFGAHKVLSEFFPFYDFHGETRYLLHEKNKS